MAVVITAVDPSRGNAGDFVTITGSGFTGAREVSFGANSCGLRYEVIADDSIVCYVPDGTGAVAVKVAGVTGPTFTYATTMPAPTVAAITPNAGSSGDTVAITGTGLASTRSVTFDGVVAAFVVASASQLDVLVPAGTGSVTVTVTTPYGSATKPFTYAALAVPTLSSVAPSKGFPGDPCTLTGAGFLTACGVAFGGLSASFMVASDSTIVCYVPEDALAGSCNVTVAGPGGDSAAATFTVGAVALPRTTASGVQKSAYDGWAAGPVTVTLAADPNGGPGVVGTFYQLDNAGITAYSGAFQVSGSGSHHVVWWSVDVRGKVEPPQSGYVNILAASLVPAGLSVVSAGFDNVLAKWTTVASASPVSYRLYRGPAATGPWTKVADTVANIVGVPQPAADGARYYAVAGVDVNGSESSKSAAFGPISAAALPDATIADGSITMAKLATGIVPPRVVAALPTLPDAAYPAGSTVVLTTDGKLYRTKDGTAGSWTAAVPSGDVSGQLGTTQIADDAITTAKIGALQVTAAEMAANTITAGQIATGAISADELAAGSVYARNLLVGNFDNLIPNGNSEANVTGAPTGAVEANGISATSPYSGSKCREREGTGVNSTLQLTAAIACSPGEKYQMQAQLRNSVVQTGTMGCKLSLNVRNAAGATIAWGVSPLVQSDQWTAVNYEYTVPANAVDFIVYLYNYALPAGQFTYADELYLRRKVDANLVVDGAITAVKLNVADVQAAVVTAAAVNALAINAGSITAGTLDVARVSAGSITAAKLDAADVKANLINAAYINTLSLNASVITAGTVSATYLDVAGLKTQLITAANINALNLNAVNITGGTIKGVVVEGGTIRTAAATLKRVELASSDNTIKFWSMDSQELTPATIAPYVYGSGQGGYLSIIGPKVIGQSTTSYISLHGTTTRKDILIAALGGGSMTIGPVSYPSDVIVSDSLRVSGRVIAGEVGHRRDPVLISHDFQGTSMCYATGGTEVGDGFWNYDITNGLASSGGATALDVAGHIGIIQFYSASAAANSGRSILTNGSTIRLQSGDVMEFSFMCPSVASSCRTRLGHFDTTTTGTPANGAYLNISGATLRGYVDATSTGTTYTLTAGVWYGARIEVSGSTVIFTVYDSGLNTATVLWTSTVAAAPYGAAFFGMATYNTAASNIYTLAMDYMGLSCSPRNR